MYLEFYKLKEKPFSLTPDPAFLYHSRAHRRAIAFLKYGLQESKGFLQLTGPVGSGKTTLLRAILAELDETAKTAYIMNPCAPFPDLLRSIMKDLEIPNIPQTRLKMELLDFFHDYLLVQMRRSNPVIIIFDEAQNLSLKNLEEIRMLSNFETTKGKLIQIVLVGQPELVKTINMPDLRQLKQRIQVRYHLSPLVPKEVKEYINHRLQVAGSDGGILFTQDACRAIYEFSEGIPRLINSVCDVALLIGYVNEQKRFDESVVEEAIRELDGSFDTEPPEAERDETPSAQVDRPDAEPEPIEVVDNQATEGPPSGPPPSVEVSARIEPPTAPDEGTERVLLAESLPAADLTHSVSDAGAAVDVIEAEVPTEIDDAQPESPTVEEEVAGEQSDPNPAAGEIEAAPAGRPRPRNSRVGTGRRQGQREELLHSLLKHGGTGRFHVGGSGIAKAVKPHRNFPKGLRELLTKFVSGITGSNASIASGAGKDAHDGAPLREAIRGLATTVSHARSRGDRLPIKIARGNSPAAAGKSAPFSDGESASRPRPEWAGRTPKGRSIGRRAYKRPKYFVNSKVAVIFRDGRVALGSTKDISVNDIGFYLTPHRSRNGARQRFIAFEQTLALRFLGGSEEGWEKKYSMTCLRPANRQIVATLMNGEVIEGITPKRFDPDCARFFVMATDDEGNSSWALVERDGTAGILTEEFAEGIFADQFIPLPDLAELSQAVSRPPCRSESAGDSFFSVGDYASALVEYDKAKQSATDPKRLDRKISLAHFNRGVERMKTGDYLRARSEFEAVKAEARLREAAGSRIELLRRMLGERDGASSRKDN